MTQQQQTAALPAWTRSGPAVFNAQGRQVAWCGYARHIGSSMAVTPEEQDQALALIAEAPTMAAAFDPDTLDAIADEIAEEWKHSARALSLRVLARQQRAILARLDAATPAEVKP